MWLHYLLLFLICLIIFLTYNSKRSNRAACIALFTLFFIFSAFRSVDVGNDTLEYFRIFELISNQTSLKTALTVSRYEVGYIAYNYVISRFTDEFQWVVAINSGIYISAVIWFINKYSKSFNKAIILFFTFGMFYSAMNIERQCIAIAIFLFAIPFLEKKEYIKYFLLILLAASFHSMSLILLALAVIPKIDFSKSKDIFKWGLLATIFLVTLNYVIGWLMDYFPYLSHYLTDSMYSEGGIRTASLALCGIRLLVVILLLIVNKGSLSNGYKNEIEINSIFNKLILLDCVVSIASIGFNMYDRIERYVCIGFIVATVNAIETHDNKWNRRLIFGIVFISSLGYLTISLIYRPEWSGIIPYTFYN